MLLSSKQIDGYKPITYEKLPDNFDQTTQYVVQLEPIENDERIYIGIEVRDLEIEDEDIDENIF